VLLDSTTDDTQLLYQGKVVRVREGATGKALPAVQTMQSSPPKPPTAEDLKQAEFNKQVFGAPKISPPFDQLPAAIQQLRLWALNNPKLSAATEDFWAEELQAMYRSRQQRKYLLGNLPLLVVLPQDANSEAPKDVSDLEWEKIKAEKRQQKLELVNLSHNSKVVFAAKSGHHVQLDQPELVVRVVRQAVEAARRHTTLRPGE
jgi:pimeloyl-ACP methyl ester carboxylesterase